MPTLILKLAKGEMHVPFIAGRSLQHILNDIDVRVRAGCNGTGACGLCEVRVVAGEVNEPTQNELVHIDNSQLIQGIRLACQVMPDQDLQIVGPALASKSIWRCLDGVAEKLNNVYSAVPLFVLPSNGKRPYGIAVDLGTTNIKLSLYDLSSGQWIAGRYGLNPQTYAGSDVMTRLVAAFESPTQAGKMSQQVVEAVGEALWDMAIKEGFELGQVIR